jgi:hypothetical protein
MIFFSQIIFFKIIKYINKTTKTIGTKAFLIMNPFYFKIDVLESTMIDLRYKINIRRFEEKNKKIKLTINKPH